MDALVSHDSMLTALFDQDSVNNLPWAEVILIVKSIACNAVQMLQCCHLLMTHIIVDGLVYTLSAILEGIIKSCIVAT